MRAYYIGYNHGRDDGYYSTLIERGGCERAYDESIDVEYVPVDKVLEIIDRYEPKEGYYGFNEYEAAFMQGKETAIEALKDEILALKGGEQE